MQRFIYNIFKYMLYQNSVARWETFCNLEICMLRNIKCVINDVPFTRIEDSLRNERMMFRIFSIK